MAIYDAGSASLAADGTVTGVGTTWRQPLTLIRVGATMIFNTTPAIIVTIAEIISDTEIRVFNDKGFTAPAGTQYSILAHDGITVQGLAQDVAETLRYYQSRETEVAAAVDAFNQFDADAFQNNVTTVNNQSQQVAADAAQVASDKVTVSADKDAVAASAASAMSSANSAAASASSVSGALIGTFQDGVTIESRSQQIIDFRNGSAQSYVWAGSLPKVVPESSTPESTGGVSSSSWVRLNESSSGIYKKIGAFGDGGTVNYSGDVVLFSDGFHYKYNGVMPYSYGSSPDSSWSNVGLLSGYDINSPENFGAKPGEPTFDSLNALNLAISTGYLYLYPNAKYYVSSEVIIPSGLIMNTNSAWIVAINNENWAGKAVVRASKQPVGTSPDLSLPDQQVRGVRHTGALNIDANSIAPYGYYGYGVVAESITDSIYAYNATNLGISLLGSWYHKVNLYMAIGCARGVSLGVPFSGEAGDTFVNAISFGSVAAYDTTRSMNIGYDPFGSLTSQLIGVGVALGRCLASSISSLTAETTSGAGVATVNATNWNVSAMYFEKCSLATPESDEPRIAFLSTTGNMEDHVFDIGSVHFGIGDGIYHRPESTEFLNIQSVYRIDTKRTWHQASKHRSSSMKFGNYYVLNAYDYVMPVFLTDDFGLYDIISSATMLNVSDYSNTPIVPFYHTGGSIKLHVAISDGTIDQTDWQVTSDEGIEYVRASGNPSTINLNQKRTAGNTYIISLGTPNEGANGKAAVYVLREKYNQWVG